MAPDQHGASLGVNGLERAGQHALDLHLATPLNDSLLQRSKLGLGLGILALLGVMIGSCCLVWRAKFGRGSKDGDNLRKRRTFFEPTEVGCRCRVEGTISSVLSSAKPPLALS